MAQSKRLIHDIAEVLQEDEKKLWNTFRLDKMNTYIVDMEEPTSEVFKCQAYTQDKAISILCSKPVLFGEKCCPEHRGWVLPPEYKNKAKFRKIITDDGDYYMSPLTQDVYDRDYKKVGYMKDETLVLFEIETDDNQEA